MEFLVVLFVLLLICITVPLVLAGVSVWQLKKKNRVSPGVKTTAPLTWLGSPSRSARLHRRLRTAVTTIRAIPAQGADTTGSRKQVCLELEQHAVALDEWLRWTSQAPGRVRRAHYDEIDRQAGQIESLAIRLSQMTPAAPGPRHAAERRDALADISSQIDILEEAHREVVEAEALSGNRAMREIEAGRAGADPRQLARASYEAGRIPGPGAGFGTGGFG
jgi:hypothetical protein